MLCTKVGGLFVKIVTFPVTLTVRKRVIYEFHLVLDCDWDKKILTTIFTSETSGSHGNEYEDSFLVYRAV